MAEVLIGKGGGAGSSDECTATSKYVYPNKTYVGYDTGDEIGKGTMKVAAGGTVYASGSDQTVVAAETYVEKAVVLSKYSTSNLSADNIKSGVKVGISNGSTTTEVTGTFTKGATAAATDIYKDKIGYANGAQVKGTMILKGAQSYTPNTKDQTIASGQCTSGDITLKGDKNFVASNFAPGAKVLGLTGVGTGYKLVTGTCTRGNYTSIGRNYVGITQNTSDDGDKDTYLSYSWGSSYAYIATGFTGTPIAAWAVRTDTNNVDGSELILRIAADKSYTSRGEHFYSYDQKNYPWAWESGRVAVPIPLNRDYRYYILVQT